MTSGTAIWVSVNTSTAMTDAQSVARYGRRNATKRRSMCRSTAAPKISSPPRLSGLPVPRASRGTCAGPPVGRDAVEGAAESGNGVFPGHAHLQIEQPAIAPALSQKRLVRAALHNPSGFEKQDFIRMHQRGQPV